MKNKYRIFQIENEYWLIEKLAFFGGTSDFFLYDIGNHAGIKRFNSKEDAQNAIYVHRKFIAKQEEEFERRRQQKEKTQYIY
jgi:hypothetical protein